MATAKPKEPRFMNFTCPDGEESILISLTSGHSVQIFSEPTRVHERFWATAINLECNPEGVEIAVKKEAAAPVSPLADIKRSIEEMIATEGDDCLTAANTPNLKKLLNYTGYNVTREQVNDAWFELQQEKKTPQDAE